MNINKKEVLRYLAYGGTNIESALEELIDRSINKAISTVKPKSTYSYAPCSIYKDYVDIKGVAFKGNSLTSHLRGCQQVALMAATLGVQSDFLIRRAQSEGAAAAAVMQAVLTALLESYCDDICRKIELESKALALYLKPRFSPGYGDLALEYQREFFKLLEVNKSIGITLSDFSVMSPSKSVTAIIGLSEEESCSPKGCTLCKNVQCEFRRTSDE